MTFQVFQDQYEPCRGIVFTLKIIQPWLFMLLRQFPNRHISCMKCNMDARSAMPLITCVPLIILSSVVYIDSHSHYRDPPNSSLPSPPSPTVSGQACRRSRSVIWEPRSRLWCHTQCQSCPDRLRRTPCAPWPGGSVSRYWTPSLPWGDSPGGRSSRPGRSDRALAGWRRWGSNDDTSDSLHCGTCQQPPEGEIQMSM